MFKCVAWILWITWNLPTTVHFMRYCIENPGNTHPANRGTPCVFRYHISNAFMASTHVRFTISENPNLSSLRWSWVFLGRLIILSWFQLTRHCSITNFRWSPFWRGPVGGSAVRRSLRTCTKLSFAACVFDFPCPSPRHCPCVAAISVQICWNLHVPSLVLKETGLLGQEEITLQILAAKHVMKLEVATAQRHYFLQGERHESVWWQSQFLDFWCRFKDGKAQQNSSSWIRARPPIAQPVAIFWFHRVRTKNFVVLRFVH